MGKLLRDAYSDAYRRGELQQVLDPGQDVLNEGVHMFTVTNKHMFIKPQQLLILTKILYADKESGIKSRIMVFFNTTYIQPFLFTPSLFGSFS